MIFKRSGSQVHGGRNLSEALPLVGGLSKDPRKDLGRWLSKWCGCMGQSSLVGFIDLGAHHSLSCFWLDLLFHFPQ